MWGQSSDVLTLAKSPQGFQLGILHQTKNLQMTTNRQIAQRADTWENTEFRSVMRGKRNLTYLT